MKMTKNGDFFILPAAQNLAALRDFSRKLNWLIRAWLYTTHITYCLCYSTVRRNPRLSSVPIFEQPDWVRSIFFNNPILHSQMNATLPIFLFIYISTTKYWHIHAWRVFWNTRTYVIKYVKNYIYRWSFRLIYVGHKWYK